MQANTSLFKNSDANFSWCLGWITTTGSLLIVLARFGKALHDSFSRVLFLSAQACYSAEQRFKTLWQLCQNRPGIRFLHNSPSLPKVSRTTQEFMAKIFHISTAPIMSKLPLLYVLCLAATSCVTHVAAAFAWDSFPDCAQPILERYAPIACDFGVNPGYELNHTNACLCSNQRFQDSSAVAIYIACGCITLSQSANQLVTNCDNTNTPAVLTADEFISTGDSNQSSCTQSFSANNNSSNNNAVTQSGPNTDLIVALAIGIPGGIIALFALVVTVLQLLVAQRALPESASPWPVIRNSFRHWCCCCTRRRPQNLPDQNKQGLPVAQVPGGVP